jgi:hypothetical protein
LNALTVGFAQTVVQKTEKKAIIHERDPRVKIIREVVRRRQRKRRERRAIIIERHRRRQRRRFRRYRNIISRIIKEELKRHTRRTRDKREREERRRPRQPRQPRRPHQPKETPNRPAKPAEPRQPILPKKPVCRLPAPRSNHECAKLALDNCGPGVTSMYMTCRRIYTEFCTNPRPVADEEACLRARADTARANGHSVDQIVAIARKGLASQCRAQSCAGRAQLEHLP